MSKQVFQQLVFRNCEKTQKDTCYTVTLTVVSTGTVTRPESSGRDTDYSLWSSQDMSDATPFPLPRSTRLHPSSSDLLLLRLQSAQLRVSRLETLVENVPRSLNFCHFCGAHFEQRQMFPPALFIAFLVLPQAGRAPKQMRTVPA